MSTRQRDKRSNRILIRRLWDNVSRAMSMRRQPVHQTTMIQDESADLMHVVQRVEGVITVQSLDTREKGHYLIADIVITVNPRISVQDGQEIARKVKLLLMHRFVHLSDVSIYVEPYNPGYPYKSNHDPNQEQMPTLLQ